MKSVIFVFIIFWLNLQRISPAPSMGQAEMVVRMTERCPFELPTMVECNLRVMQKRGKTFVNMTTTIPFKYSDKMGFDVNIAIKRNGAWKPNFFKMKGDGLCSGIKLAQRKFFVLLAKSLHAPEPYTCPLPAGSADIRDYEADMTAFQSLLMGGTLPYGELRATLNITHKNTVISCALYYVDIVPKKSKSRG